MAVAYSWNIFPPRSANVAASRPSHVRLPKGCAGSSMKRVRPRLCHWTFLRWHKIVLPTAVNRRVCGHRLPDRQTESWRSLMADKVKVWFDAEADYLEVRFSDVAGYMKETKNEALMERVDAQGHIIGFSLMGVSRFKKDKPLEADLAPA